MLLRDRTCLLLSVTVASTLAAQVAAQPTGTGFTVEVYAEMCEPSALSFDSNGFLYVGNIGCNAGSWQPAWVRRVSPGGSPVENWGTAQIRDPDAVVADVAGTYSGASDSVLVGTGATGGPAQISAIRPDESIVVVFEAGVPGNPSNLKIDNNGRLLILQLSNPPRVAVSEGDAPTTLFELPGSSGIGMAVAPDNRIYTTTSDSQVRVVRIHNPDGTVYDDNFATLSVSGTAALAFGNGGDFGTHLYAIDGTTLVRIAEDGATTVLVTGFDNPRKLAFGPDHDLYVSDETPGRIYRVAIPCGADVDDDGVVGIGDFLLVLAQWGPCPPQCLGDVDGDNIVGINDFLLVLANWGPCK